MDIRTTPLVVPVVLCGGAGTRLWPLSRTDAPKQLLPLLGKRSLFQDTLGQFRPGEGFAQPIVMTHESLRFAVSAQMQEIGISGRLVLEPVSRNTAPAIAVAALMARADDPAAILLAVPSDHSIADRDTFLDLVSQAVPAARAGYLVTFGMHPTRPETGYGYIHCGAPLVEAEGVHAVTRFLEKPDAETAGRLLAAGEHLWNAGIFLFSANAMIGELERLAPAVINAARAAVEASTLDESFIRLGAEGFSASPSISIDYAVMEKTPKAATLPCEIGWSDIGSWSELLNVSEDKKDEKGNVAVGDVIAEDCSGCYVRSDKQLVATLGVDNLVVVATEDAILVLDRDRAQDVRLIVEKLRELKRTEAITPSKVERPWGSYQSMDEGHRFQVKRLIINPGARISLQKHFHRAEHWVVVQGTALVTRDSTTHLVRENESIYIPLGAVHRLENPGKVPLHVIEVQSGAYLGEDDIVRMEDVYGRV